MKLKLLIAPLLVILIIVMAIWVVVPAYQKLQAQKEELAAAGLKLADIQTKNAMAAKLKQALADNPAQKDILLGYLPQKAQEEIIIENLSSLAQGEGLAVANLSMLDNSQKNNPSAAPVTDPVSGEIIPPALAVNSISATVGIAGPYEKIRSFLGKLAAFKRDNNVVSLKIVPATAGAGNLQADMVLNLAYFAGGSATVNPNSSIFSNGSFDTTVVDQIKNKLNTDIVPVNIGNTGKANPFQP